MAFTENDFKKVAELAYLDSKSNYQEHLAENVEAIMAFIEQLRRVNTTDVTPLFHPFAQYQRLRADEITETDCSSQLAEIAPSFEEGLYLVPKVIDAGQ